MSRTAVTSHFHKSKTLNDKYLLGDEIGKGAYGRVYKGVDLQNGDFVAIKQVSLENISQEDLQSIMSEIDLLKNLNHKNIVKYLGSFKTKSHLYIILEYVENGALASIIKPNKFGAFPESLVSVYIVQVLEGLVYLHEQGVIHRDIKGANILTTKEGLVKLADFGVATQLTEADAAAHSQVVGTPYWMAPEVIEMSGVSASADIWSVGCTVIELLTCVPPYYDLQPMPALFRIVQDDHPPFPENISPPLLDFLVQCFQKDAKLRPDAKELMKHPWIRNSRRQLQSSWRRNAGRLSQINKDVVSVVEKTMEGELGEEPDEELPPSPIADGVICRDPFDSDTDEERKSNHSSTPPSTSYVEGGVQSLEGMGGGALAALRLQKRSLPNLRRTSSEPEAVANPAAADRGPHPTHQTSGGATPNILSWTGTAGLSEEPARPPRPMRMERASYGDGLGSIGGLMASLGGDRKGGIDIVGGRERMRDRRRSAGGEPSGAAEGGDLLRKSDSELLGKLRGRHEAHANGASLHLESASLQAVNRGRLLGSAQLSGLSDSGTEQRPETDSSNEPLSSVITAVFAPSSIQSTGVAGVPDLGGSRGATAGGRVVVSTSSLHLTAYQRREEQEVLAVIEGRALQTSESKRGLLGEASYVPGPLDARLESDEDLDGLEKKLDGRDGPTKQAMEVQRLLFLMRGDKKEAVNLQAAEKLAALFREHPEQKEQLIAHHGVTPVLDMLDVTNSQVIPAVLQVLNTLIADSVEIQESLCLVGVIPTVLAFASLDSPRAIRSQVAEFVRQLCATSALTLQMLIAARGLPVLVGFLDPDYWEHRIMIHGAIDGIWKVLELQSATPRTDICRLFARCGALERLVCTLHNVNEEARAATQATAAAGSAMPGSSSQPSADGMDSKVRKASGDLMVDIMPTFEAGGVGRGFLSPPPRGGVPSTSYASASPLPPSKVGRLQINLGGGQRGSGGGEGAASFAEVAREYVEKTANLLLVFAHADSAVKSAMCSLQLLHRLFKLLDRLEPHILIKVLRCIKQLAIDPNTLEPLQRAGAIPHLVPFLERRDSPHVAEIHNQVVGALYQLCKVNKTRQEQAAVAGIIPQLMHIIARNSPLKQYALPLLCDMAHASRRTRAELWRHRGLEFYLDLLKEEVWHVTALDSIAVWLAHDHEQKKVEHALLERENVRKLVEFFEACNGPSFVHVLEPFLKIITKSARLNTALATSGLTPILVSRLDNGDAVARVNLLKVIKAVYEHHPRPKQFIVEHDLPQKLQRLIEGERDGEMVLVKQMASGLLKALQINTVL